MHAGVVYHQAEFRRGKIGDVLIVAFDDDRNIILYPQGGSPNLTTVFLEEGDEFSIDNIPSHLINQYRLDGLDMARCVGKDLVWFIDHPNCPEVSLHEFAGWYKPVTLTVTHLAGADYAKSQSELSLVSP